MKKTLFLLLLMVAATVTVNAQTIKIGRINSGVIISAMPEAVAATNKLKAQYEIAQENLTMMDEEYNKKFAKYQKEFNTAALADKQQQEQDLRDLQEKMTKYNESAETNIKTMQDNLMTPIYQKFGDALKAVSKEQAMTLVIDMVQPPTPLIYVDEASIKDLNDLVAKKLGITLPAAPAAPATPAK